MNSDCLSEAAGVYVTSVITYVCTYFVLFCSVFFNFNNYNMSPTILSQHCLDIRYFQYFYNFNFLHLTSASFTLVDIYANRIHKYIISFTFGYLKW